MYATKTFGIKVFFGMDADPGFFPGGGIYAPFNLNSSIKMFLSFKNF